MTFQERLNRLYTKANDAVKSENYRQFEHYITILRGICVALEYGPVEHVWKNEVLCKINELEVYWGICNE